MSMQTSAPRVNLRPLYRSGFVLGFGLGGFLDGIILHQVLQWHHLVSSVYPTDTLLGLEMNTWWDGIFHIAMYVVTVVGLILLWRALTRSDVPYSPYAVLGAIGIGFGTFHIVDSLINHWLLGIHHICYEPNTVMCDMGYFVIGVVLILIGFVLLRQVNIARK